MTAFRVASGFQTTRLAAPAFAGATAYLVFLAWAMANTSYDIWGALVVGPVLVAITVPLAARMARGEEDPRMARLVVTALVLKLLGSLPRYAILFDVYGGSGDAAAYDDWGRLLAPSLRNGDFTVEVGARLMGTGFVRLLTGIVYAIVGPTKLGGFLIFSWLGFWGLYFFYRAFLLALPDGDVRRYARLLFFLPSLIFWPSSIGKDAWMTLTLGLTAYGTARLLTRGRGGFALLGLGVFGTMMVRPHVTVLVFVALSTSYLLRRARRASLFGPVPKLVGMAVLLAVGAVALTQAQQFFGVQKLDSQGVEQVLSESERKSTQGGSSFEASRPSSPAEYPMAVVSVLFRPFPHEAHNLQSLITSFEGLVMLVLFAHSLPRLLALPAHVRRVPYVAFAAVYVLLFAYAFSSFGNFGIIARQRVQVLPLALVLLSIGDSTARERPEAQQTGRRSSEKIAPSQAS